MDLGCSLRRVGDLLDDEVGHVGVDFAGQLDEAGAEVELLGLPGEIEGVDGDAVAAEAGAGIEGLEAEGLGFGRVDDFVDVDAHAHAELLELVDQRDVDAAVDVLKQLGHLGDRGAADRERRGGRWSRRGPRPARWQRGRSRRRPWECRGGRPCRCRDLRARARRRRGRRARRAARATFRPCGLPASSMGTTISSVVPG